MIINKNWKIETVQHFVVLRQRGPSENARGKNDDLRAKKAISTQMINVINARRPNVTPE